MLTLTLLLLAATPKSRADAGAVSDPAEWNGYGKAAPAAPAGKHVSAIPPAAKPRYQEAAGKLEARDYSGATVALNALAAEFPKVPEVFSSRCSAQLGLQQWAYAEADCTYALSLVPRMPTATYGLAVAEDGQSKYAQAIAHYKEYAAMSDASPALKATSLARVQQLGPQAAAPAAAAADPNAGTAKGTFVESAPPAGKASLYVYRNMLMGIGTPATLSVDGKRISDLPNDHYLEVHVSPGNHTLSLAAAVTDSRRPAPTSTVQVTVTAGQSGYYKLEYAPQHDDVGFALTPVAAATGRNEIREDCALMLKRAL